ncbi:glycosyltransferase [Arthrobacter sp. MW3 TE3886]|uniref:glycosyltransferase n=1 Tax=Arthrobacter sp. MW3 TE3886 TaxID=3156254 RepID=UPI0035154C61
MEDSAPQHWGFNMFYGVTRYSLFSPGSHSWKTSRSGVFKTPEDYMQYLFSEKRLSLRAEMFFEKAVPALSAMAENHDYKHFVMYSELLPKRHQEILFAAAARYPFLVPVEWNDVVRGTGIEEVKPLIEQDLASKFDADAGVQPVAWFRLDDDDLLAADYLTHLEVYRTLNHVGMAISFGLGLTAYKGEHDLVNLREFYHPKSAQGMAFVSAFDPRQRSLSIVTPGPHHGVDQVMPTILDSREHMFFQVRHSDQDSTLNETPHERVAASLARLDKLPAVRSADISAEKWPSLIEDIVRGEPTPHELFLPDAGPLRLTTETALVFPLEPEVAEGMLEFEFEFESAQELTGAFAVVSYELNAEDGVDVEELGLSLGLQKSPFYGMYRLAWSKSTHGVMRQNLLLPEGVSVSGITLRGKKRQPADVYIRLREPRFVAVHGAD